MIAAPSLMSSCDLLAISPHPDDVELWCSGAIILAADQGRSVVVLDLSRGEKSSRGSPVQRGAERECSSALMGLRERHCLELPDCEIGRDPAHRDVLIAAIRRLRPRIVLAPHWSDRHPDHAATGGLVREACFFAGVGALGEGTAHRPQQVFFYMAHQPFSPSFVLDVSAVWERRMATVHAYRSQFSPAAGAPETALSQPGFLRYLEARAIVLGAMIGVAYGEGFFVPGPVPCSRLPDLESGNLGVDAPWYRPF